MPTSIRDLLDALETERWATAGDHDLVRHVTGALSEISRALTDLTRYGLTHGLNGRREALTTEVAAACHHASGRINLRASDRMTNLAGSLADVVAIRRARMGCDERWAITVAVAATTRIVAAQPNCSDHRRDEDLAWTRLSARNLLVYSLGDAPFTESQNALIWATPAPVSRTGEPASRAALDAVMTISDRLHQSSAGLAPPPTLLEVFAITRVAESVERFAESISVTPADRTRGTDSPAVGAWGEVRNRLHPYIDSNPRRTDRDLHAWAQRAHMELCRQFGDPRAPRAPRAGEAVVRDLYAMAVEVPVIAHQLAAALERMASNGELHALAPRLPFREDRVTEFLNRSPIVADHFDLVAVTDSITAARSLAVGTATTLGNATASMADRLPTEISTELVTETAQGQAVPESARMSAHIEHV